MKYVILCLQDEVKVDNKKKTKKRDSKGKIKTNNTNNNGESSNFNHRNELNEEISPGISFKTVVYLELY